MVRHWDRTQTTIRRHRVHHWPARKPGDPEDHWQFEDDRAQITETERNEQHRAEAVVVAACAEDCGEPREAEKAFERLGAVLLAR
jgi:hypothetical protein